MATSTSYRCFIKHQLLTSHRLTGRIAVSVTAAVIFLAWGSPIPARAQCSPQEQAKLIASDAAPIDEFGFFVAISGDTAVVGAFLDDHVAGDAGSAYVFVRSGGVWTFQAKLIASDAGASDNFGVSVAVSGDTAVIGAYTDDHAGGNSAGSAYIFVRSVGVWTQEAKLTASDAAMNDLFGRSVAIDGDTVVVGAYGDDTSAGFSAGSAYVFVKPGGGWTNMTEITKLTTSDAMENDQFGYSVALSEGTAVIGANLDHHGSDPGGFDGPGSAYVFVGAGAVWTEQARLTASDAAGFEFFGESVAVSEDTAVVGAIFDVHAGGSGSPSGQGSAYVFVRSGAVWTQQAKLTASDAAASDRFGWSVSVSGNTAVAGARLDDHASGTDAGSAYVFAKPAGGWANMTETAKLTASDAAASDQFGTSVAVSQGTAVIGAPLEDPAGGSNAGSAYVFDLGCAVACCAGDFDGNNVVTTADMPDFVTALLAGGACAAPPACCPGDFNSDEMVAGTDIRGFLTKLLSGGVCP